MSRTLFPLLLAICILPLLPALAHAQGCTLHTLSECDNTNQLVWDQAFDDALADFIGDRPAGWLYEDGTMLGQVQAVLGGPSNAPVYFSNNLVRFSACRHHSCPEKGAVVLTTDGEIVAVGVIHFDVSRHFTLNPMLTTLTREKGDRFQTAADHLFAWYEKVITDHNKSLIERYGHEKAKDDLNSVRDPEIIILEP